jgi:hypothetical protein
VTTWCATSPRDSLASLFPSPGGFSPFVRDDQPPADTATQLALAIADEVTGGAGRGGHTNSHPHVLRRLQRRRGRLGRPGIYDVHSPLVPSIDELAALLRDAVGALGAGRVWANPDCGLKTRSYDEVVPALRHLVAAARRVREEQKPPHIAKAQLAPNTEPTARSSRGE